MVEFVARLPRPVPDRPLFSDAGAQDAAPNSRVQCGPRNDLVDHIASTTSAGWVIMHGWVASTPVARERRVARSSEDGRDLVLRESRFEFRSVSVCATEILPQRQNYFVNHWNEVLHDKIDGSLYRSRLNPLDNRRRRAGIAQGRERVLVLTRDVSSPGDWLLLASLNVENGALQEGALDAPATTPVEVLMVNCRRSVSGGVR